MTLKLAAAFAAVLAIAGASQAGAHVIYGFDTIRGWPNGDLVLGPDGSLYGTTARDGARGNGTVYRLGPDGTRTVLHEFTGTRDGRWPEAGVVRDAQGNLYGTTSSGGPNNDGTAFKIAADGTFTLLHAFEGGSDGANPHGRLLRDAAGDLYGTTYAGGGAGCWGRGCGALFKLAPDGAMTILHVFGASDDAYVPVGGVIADTAGNLYGMTMEGGPGGWGTVYKYDTAGQLTLLTSFACCAIYGPTGELAADTQGNLYGTTANATGSVFKIAPDGTFTVVHLFASKRDGQMPTGGNLYVDAQGDVFGNTLVGGHRWGNDVEGAGIVFEIAHDGTYSILHYFGGANDGARPVNGMAVDAKGVLYGATEFGGPENGGTLFRFKTK